MIGVVEFNKELAQNLIYSKEEFPVDLDDAYVWLGYSRKDNAKRKLVKYFIEGIDYSLLRSEEPTPAGGFSNKETIKLTTGCFKELGMLAGTEKGKQIRKYFLECEKIAKQVSNLPEELRQVLFQMQNEMKVLTERTKRLDELETASQKHKGCGNVIKAEAYNADEDDLVTAFEYLKLKGFGYEQVNKLARRAANFSRVGIGNNYEPPKTKKGHLLFEVKYLDEAFLSICNL